MVDRMNVVLMLECCNPRSECGMMVVLRCVGGMMVIRSVGGMMTDGS